MKVPEGFPESREEKRAFTICHLILSTCLIPTAPDLFICFYPRICEGAKLFWSPFCGLRCPESARARAPSRLGDALFALGRAGRRKGQSARKTLSGWGGDWEGERWGADTNHRSIRRRCCRWLRLRRPPHSTDSTAGAPAREAGDSARERRDGAPSAPRSRLTTPSFHLPRWAPAWTTRPSLTDAHGGPELAAERTHASSRAHSMVRCGRRAFSPPARSAALQVRRQVGARGSHGGTRPCPAPASLAFRWSCSPRRTPPALAGHGGALRVAGWRARPSPSARGRGTRVGAGGLRDLPSMRPSGSVRSSEAPGEPRQLAPPEPEPSARLSTAP